MSNRRAIAALGVALWACLLSPGAAQAPLSAIDWLSDTLARPTAPRPRATPPGGRVTGSALPDPISVRRLGMPAPDRIALVPAADAGLPRDLWGASASDRLARLLAIDTSDALPAVRDLHKAMLVADLDPPRDSAGDLSLYLARADTLIRLGDLDRARALLERGDMGDGRVFRRWFDVALLTGRDDVACGRLRADPRLAPSWSTRILCLARGGDWSTAAITLRTAASLGELAPGDAALLERFLEDGAEDPAKRPAAARHATPLDAALNEGAGTPLSTAALPLPFAHLDMRSVVGWKPRLDAAERLARAGAITPRQLWQVYGERRPAASGGVWDRVAAVQGLDAALSHGDADEIAPALTVAWAELRAAGLEDALARRHDTALGRHALAGASGDVALRAWALSQATEVSDAAPPDHDADVSLRPAEAARTAGSAATVSGDSEARFLATLAGGDIRTARPFDDRTSAIAEGFDTDARPPDDIAELIAADRRGEAVLRAIALFDAGEAGNHDALRDAIATLRAVGLGPFAARAMVELLALERRG